MFLIYCKKLDIQKELIDAIKTLRTEKGSKKNTAFADLRDTFAGQIRNKFNSVKHLANYNKDLEDEIKHNIETLFLECLMNEKMDLTDPYKVLGYINYTFNTRVNVHSIRNLLGQDEIISNLQKNKNDFGNAIKNYFKKNKKMPDFQNEEELEDFSKNFINKKKETVLDIAKMFGTSMIKSLQKEVGGEDSDDNAITLMDTIKSNEPLADNILQDKELKDILFKAIDSSKPINKKMFLMFYLPDDPETQKILTAEEKEKFNEKMKQVETHGHRQLTKEEIAEITGISPRNVRQFIDNVKEIIKKDEDLKQLVYSRRINNLVKFAIRNYYNTQEDLIKEIIKSK
jgi:hypothetical protein